MTPPQSTSQEQGQHLLQQVHKGMTAYDSDSEKVGEVDMIYLGAEDPAAEATPATAPEPYRAGQDSVPQLIADLFDHKKMPKTVANRLLHSGFLHLDGAAIIGSDYFVFPEQLAAVSEDEIHLSVSREELMEDRW